MKRLFAAAAFAPLCFAALDARAQTTISTAQTTPVVTSTAGNVDITTAGSVTVKTGAAVTIDSDATVKADGVISVRDAIDGVGIRVTTKPGGTTSGITIGNNIFADDSELNTDTDKDGDLDGDFVKDGAVRYGVRVTGDGAFIGNIVQNTGTIAVEGNNGSAGISIETPLTGNLTVNSTIGVLGTNSYGVRVTGPVTGDVDIGGTITVQGQNGAGILVQSDVTGVLRLDGNVTATGYRYPDRATVPTTAIGKLDADDLLQGGTAVRITGNLSKGLVIDAAPGDSDPTNADEDADGVPDANETNAIIRALGSAPALVLGGATDIEVKAVGTGPYSSLGLQINGTVTGDGVYDGFSATGAVIGGQGGKVNVEGGAVIRGAVNARAILGNATGLVIGSGASVPLILVDGGQISAGSQSSETLTTTSNALLIQAGANVDHIFNTGTIRAGVNGPTGNATAIADLSGTVTKVTNTGVIRSFMDSLDPDKPATGNTIALDFRNAVNGVTISQLSSGSESFIASIDGDVLLANGNDNFGLASGRFNANAVDGGVLHFAGGDDNFLMLDGVTARVDLRKEAGKLSMGVGGDLTLTNTHRVPLTTLEVTGTGRVTFTLDPQSANPMTRGAALDVSGVATFNPGSAIDLEFISKLGGATTFEILRADTFVANGVDTSLGNDLPYIFKGGVRYTANQILVDVAPRSTEELNLRNGRADAYDAFYSAFDKDPVVARAVLTKTNEQDFRKLYDQFLPDYSGGPFSGISNGVRAVFQAQAEEAKNMVPGEPRSWLQEVGVGTKFESVNDIEYQTGGFGIAAGFEKPMGANSVYGFSGSFITSEIRNANRFLGSLLTGSTLMSSLYWRGQEGGMTIDASFSGGFSWIESDRRLVDQDANGFQNLIRQASADWNASLGAGRVGVSYEWDAAPFYVRHDAVLDAVYLREGSFAETGGGPSVNLGVAGRETYEIAAEAGILLGARFGRTFRWGPELRVAYRGILEGGQGETVARFSSTPDSVFILPGLIKDRQRISLRAALRGSGAYSNFALEASGDFGQYYTAYMARVMVRFLF